MQHLAVSEREYRLYSDVRGKGKTSVGCLTTSWWATAAWEGLESLPKCERQSRHPERGERKGLDRERDRAAELKC